MNRGITLLVFHSMTSKLNAGSVFAHVCFALLSAGLRDNIWIILIVLFLFFYVNTSFRSGLMGSFLLFCFFY